MLPKQSMLREQLEHSLLKVYKKRLVCVLSAEPISKKKTTLCSADNSDLDLNVELANEALFSDRDAQPYVGGASQCDAIRGEKEGNTDEEKLPLITGNITFLTFANLSFDPVEEVDYFYKYIIRGPVQDDKVATCSRQSNWTGEYLEIGNYHYVIHAIAKLNQVMAFHANVTGRFEVLGKKASCIDIPHGFMQDFLLGREMELRTWSHY